MNPSDLPDETLFEGALKCRTPAERAAYLDQACADQPELRRNVEALLQAHDQSGEFLEPTVVAARPTSKLELAPEETSGTMIGRYKLLQKIGEGGMGVVYMAEQTEPVIRKVALKIIKLGMDTKQVVARFEAERQALALMDHPNIAKILDAGVTESSVVHESEGRARHSVRAENPRPESGAQGTDAPYPPNAVMSTGRPYFVMELVHGVPITEYCDKNKLSTQQRLELFIPVCQAIQHAHQKGIIHRDIKPSNVMVTLHDGRPVPKVIDFGVAKATNQRLTEKTLFTHYAQMIGTPAYMSPEQAEMSGLDIDTRTDVYSLGVLLYELLTGSTPFNAKELLSKGYAEMQRIIVEQEPPKPSTRMSMLRDEERTVVATNRSMEASALNKVLKGDLDWVMMKALEKDRKRRYETANGLATDLRRHLADEPVTAIAPSAGYKFRKFARRNKVALVVAVTIAAVLLIATGISVWQAVRATRAERQTKAAADRSSQVSQFLKDMLQGVGPAKALGRDTKMLHEILTLTAERVGNDLKAQPEVEAELRLIIGKTYLDLGLRAEADTMTREALRLRELIFGAEHQAVADALNSLGVVLYYQGDLPAAEPVARKAVAMMKKFRGPEHLDVASALNNLGNVLQTRNDLAGAEQAHSEALAIRRKLLGDGHRDVAGSLNNLGNDFFLRGDLANAESSYLKALAIFETQPGATNPTVATVNHNLGIVLSRQGDLTGAETIQRKVLAMRRALLPEDHGDLAVTLNELAMVLAAQGRLVEAEAKVTEAAGKKLVRSDDWRATTTTNTLAIVLSKKGDLAAAEAKYRQTLAKRIELLGEDHPASTETLNLLGILLAARGDLAGAEATLRRTLALVKKSQGDDHPELVTALWPLAWVLRQQGNPTDAELFHREAVTLSRPRGDYRGWALISSIYELADLLQVQGKFTETEPLLMEAFDYTQNHRSANAAFERGVLEHLVCL